MSQFEYAIKVLGGKIGELSVIDNCGCHTEHIKELQKAIQVFIRGQGYLTRGDHVECPVGVVFFDKMEL